MVLLLSQEFATWHSKIQHLQIQKEIFIVSTGNETLRKKHEIEFRVEACIW